MKSHSIALCPVAFFWPEKPTFYRTKDSKSGGLATHCFTFITRSSYILVRHFKLSNTRKHMTFPQTSQTSTISKSQAPTPARDLAMGSNACTRIQGGSETRSEIDTNASEATSTARDSNTRQNTNNVSHAEDTTRQIANFSQEVKNTRSTRAQLQAYDDTESLHQMEPGKLFTSSDIRSHSRRSSTHQNNTSTSQGSRGEMTSDRIRHSPRNAENSHGDRTDKQGHNSDKSFFFCVIFFTNGSSLSPLKQSGREELVRKEVKHVLIQARYIAGEWFRGSFEGVSLNNKLVFALIQSSAFSFLCIKAL